jgi:hypothetical protein
VANSYYDIECIDEELEIYSVLKRSSGTTYCVTKTDDGWLHECKATQVRGNDFMCRHKLMVIQKYYANPAHKSLFNISPKRTNGKSPRSQTG